MKKILIFVMVIIAFITGCGNDKNDSKDSENSTNVLEKNTEMDKHSEEEKIVVDWLDNLKNNYEYEQLFDTQTVQEADAEVYAQKTKTDANYYIFYSDESKIMFSKELDEYGMKAFILKKMEDGAYKFSYAAEDLTFIQEKACAICNGSGQVVVGTRQENGQYACTLCNGTGWLSNQYYDAVLGWQTNTYGCGGCGGAGWLNGVHTVNIYEKCEDCNGFGVQ